MDVQGLLGRILQTVDDRAYLTPSSQVDPSQRLAMGEIAASLHDPEVHADTTRALAQRLHDEGRIDRVMLLSALHVIAASPKVRDHALAARLAGEQEWAALELGGPRLEANLASVERHRGVLAFMQRRYEVALDYFTRALERERTAENLGNVLCALIRLDEEDEARALLEQVRRALSPELVRDLDRRVDSDPDLVLLRTEPA